MSVRGPGWTWIGLAATVIGHEHHPIHLGSPTVQVSDKDRSFIPEVQGRRKFWRTFQTATNLKLSAALWG